MNDLNTGSLHRILEESCYYSYVNGSRIIAICGEEPPLRREYLKGVREFRIFETPLSRIDYLRNLGTLEIVDVHNTRVKDLTPLIENPIRYLDISVTAVNDLFPLEKIGTIEVLKLSNLNIDNLDSIGKIPSLRELHIDFCYSLKSIEPLRNLDSLEYLNMAHTNISDASPILKLAESGVLKKVDLTDTFVPKSQIAELIGHGVDVIIRAKEYPPRI